ncbi:MAG: hypothetical protein IJS52_02915 [Bacilli bacterium]|nr:hypothetical protein [Bacilli bacterium]
MRLPSKFTPYKQSVISKFPIVLEALETSDMTVMTLYKKVKSNMNGLKEFMEILDCLFILKKITLEEERMLHYAG